MTTCPICFRHCVLGEGERGFCHARVNKDGRIIAENYGKVSSIALDPIEKKPLARFYPGSMILSVGSYGCNFRCPFCQNNSISMCSDCDTVYVSPEQLVTKALKLKSEGNIGIAYTYNEPLIGYEYVLDCSKLAHENGLKNVVVTNGGAAAQPLFELLPYIDAMNIDLKGFTKSFYDNIAGDLEAVKASIELCAKHCHLEVTTLIVPNENDSVSEISEIAHFLASVDKNIPLHITRFYPRYLYEDREPASASKVRILGEEARRYLKYVFVH